MYSAIVTLASIYPHKSPPTQSVAHVFDIHSHSPSPPPPFLRGAYFGSTSSVPKMDLSPSTLRIMARGIYRTVLPTGLRPRLPIHRRPLSSGVYSLFSGTQASSHERTTIANPPCPSSSTLDRTRFPRRNISETREISEDWLASAELQA